VLFFVIPTRSEAALCAKRQAALPQLAIRDGHLVLHCCARTDARPRSVVPDQSAVPPRDMCVVPLYSDFLVQLPRQIQRSRCASSARLRPASSPGHHRYPCFSRGDPCQSARSTAFSASQASSLTSILQAAPSFFASARLLSLPGQERRRRLLLPPAYPDRRIN